MNELVANQLQMIAHLVAIELDNGL